MQGPGCPLSVSAEYTGPAARNDQFRDFRDTEDSPLMFSKAAVEHEISRPNPVPGRIVHVTNFYLRSFGRAVDSSLPELITIADRGYDLDSGLVVDR